MGRLASAYGQAVAAHRHARERWAHARALLDRLTGQPVPERTVDLVARLGRLADALTAPGARTARPAGAPAPVRIGQASTADGRFPLLVPLGAGRHLAVNADARDPRVAVLLRVLVLRLLATTAPGAVRVVGVDPAALGATFLPLRALRDAGVLGATATTEVEIGALLDAAQAHARAAQQADRDDHELLLVVAASTPGPRELARLAALTHAGPAASVCVLLAGYPASSPGQAPPPLGATTTIRLDERYAWIGDPPGNPYGDDGAGLAVPVLLDPDPPAQAVRALAERLDAAVRAVAALHVADLLPERRWTESARAGLRTVVGRAGREPVTLAFDDATPHWLVGGRTGAGKTVFLLDVLYGLAARYAPAELQLWLLDFKEGVSFTEFVPTARDPSFLPHARAVGVESDREYGLAVLRELRRDLGRRADLLKRHGVSKLADLPADAAAPRVVAVVDEFHVLLAGNDRLAREAVDLLEELARKGRSYGVHLVLASQSTTGIEALYGRADTLFGQFALRVALPGGEAVLGVRPTTSAATEVGTAVVNTAAGAPGADRLVRFPDAHADARQIARLRYELWDAAPEGVRPPSVFRGYEPAHLEDDPAAAALRPGAGRPVVPVGRTVDVDGSPARFALDATPGRHLAVVGTSATGAHVLRAAGLGLARQHAPGEAEFVLAPLVEAADALAEETIAGIKAAGHPVTVVDAAELRRRVGALAADPGSRSRTYLVVFGMDAAAGALGRTDPGTFRSGHDDLRTLLRQGPGQGTHLLGWWRGLRRLGDDLGGSQHRDDVACLVALNVPAADLGLHLGVTDLAYTPRPHRALLVDRHAQRTALIVPFVRAGHRPDAEEH
ncbi:FtsK/SpoIIIE domain-containing protein [Micromonospora sp. KC723]|uniref:FtsK/SpoIIIE domain-containing protein n=1 Tax=Micromonospora sp. KC723 TaxID=2530381 RepID=UPI001051E99F|nr:FtsK/SpoIIIE domain-containing protein [Micromonospora sp. KC723]TDB76096.1 cell division protein FtsK [Micromonospora sp. KC723]